MHFDLDIIIPESVQKNSIQRSVPEKPVNPISLSYELKLLNKNGNEIILPLGKYAMLYAVKNGYVLEGKNREYKIRITYGKTFGNNPEINFTIQYFRNNVVVFTDHTANMEWIIKYYLKWF